MGIALIIVSGVVLLVFFPSLFDYLTKKRKKNEPELMSRIAAIEKKVSELEMKSMEKDEIIRQLESEVSFVNKLISEKTK